MKNKITTTELSRRIRVDAIKMVNRGGSSHIGSVLSIADILAVLYGEVLQFDTKNPKWDKRDRFILSKGHAGAGVYAALAETGFFDVERLQEHCQNGSVFSGHVSHIGIPGVELSTGSLGHGLPVAAGLAYAGKLDKRGHKVFVVMSDGECDEGSNWEAALFAAHHNLDNLVSIIDRNYLQSMTTTENTLRLEPLDEKWKAFGWEVVTVDGHDHDELKEALQTGSHGRPKCIIAKTIKGKGVSYMENKVEWHYRTPLGKDFEIALKELEIIE